jgi:tripartite-type tricarboxylate transporter receptor subunit TctC
MGWRAGSVAIFGLAAALLVAPQTRAAEFPNRPIKLVIPYAAGGPTDIFGRVLADYMGRDLKQSVIVENKGGAQGAIAAEMIARSEPDGYTLFGTSGSVLVLNPLLYKKLSYDPVKDFKMLALVTAVPLVMNVNPSVPAKTVQEFVAYAKANPGKINFGSSGTGSFTHLAGEMFKQMAGVEMTHVAYKGAAPALTDTIAGNIQLMFESVTTSLPPIQSNLLRPIGIGALERDKKNLPDVPTLAESGYPDYFVTVWNAIAISSKVPDDVAKVLKDSLDRVMNDPGFRAAIEKAGFEALRPRSFAEIEAYVEAERVRWGKVIKAQNITLD